MYYFVIEITDKQGWNPFYKLKKKCSYLKIIYKIIGTNFKKP